METAKTAKGGRQVGVVFADLVVDPALQPRLSGLDSEHVAALAETPEAWPPLVAIRRDGGLVVIDGFHRMKAAEVLGLKKIEVEVRELAAGEDARSVAFSLNLFHGRPLLIPDRRAEASRLLKHSPQLADREIARRSGLAPTTVAGLRRAGEESGQIEAAPVREGARGYTLNREPAAASVQTGQIVPRVADRLEKAIACAEAVAALPGETWRGLANLYAGERGIAQAELLGLRIGSLADNFARLSAALKHTAEEESGA